jgi:hypothetical protein
VERTIINKRQQELTPTNVAGVARVADDMAKSIQIARVTSSNPIHSTKISAVNCKQLTNNIIDPLFYGTYGLALSRRSHSGQSIQI